MPIKQYLLPRGTKQADSGPVSVGSESITGQTGTGESGLGIGTVEADATVDTSGEFGRETDC